MAFLIYLVDSIPSIIGILISVITKVNGFCYYGLFLFKNSISNSLPFGQSFVENVNYPDFFSIILSIDILNASSSARRTCNSSFSLLIKLLEMLESISFNTFEYFLENYVMMGDKFFNYILYLLFFFPA